MKQGTGSQKLYRHLKTHGRAEINGWAINTDGAEVQLVSPYGIDVGFYVNNTGGRTGILERILIDDHEREWGTL